MNTPNRKGSKLLAGTLLCTLTAQVCFADCGRSLSVFENTLVFYKCAADGSAWLNFVALNDEAPLKVAGRVKTAIKRGIDAYGNFGDQLITISWDRVEVYDVKNIAAPKLSATFQLKDQGSVPGYARIQEIAPGRFLLLETMGAAELTAEENGARWKLQDLPRTSELQKRMLSTPANYNLTSDAVDLQTVRETNSFRYQLLWKRRSKPGEAFGDQYLRKVDKKTGHVVSNLLVGQSYETID